MQTWTSVPTVKVSVITCVSTLTAPTSVRATSDTLCCPTTETALNVTLFTHFLFTFKSLMVKLV